MDWGRAGTGGNGVERNGTAPDRPTAATGSAEKAADAKLRSVLIFFTTKSRVFLSRCEAQHATNTPILHLFQPLLVTNDPHFLTRKITFFQLSGHIHHCTNSEF